MTGRSGESRAAHTITLLTRPGCHLCDEARAVIERVAADLGVAWQERDTLIDGVQHDFWRVSEQRLRAALSAARGPGSPAQQ